MKKLIGALLAAALLLGLAGCGVFLPSTDALLSDARESLQDDTYWKAVLSIRVSPSTQALAESIIKFSAKASSVHIEGKAKVEGGSISFYQKIAAEYCKGVRYRKNFEKENVWIKDETSDLYQELFKSLSPQNCVVSAKKNNGCWEVRGEADCKVLLQLLFPATYSSVIGSDPFENLSDSNITLLISEDGSLKTVLITQDDVLEAKLDLSRPFSEAYMAKKKDAAAYDPDNDPFASDWALDELEEEQILELKKTDASESSIKMMKDKGIHACGVCLDGQYLPLPAPIDALPEIGFTNILGRSRLAGSESQTIIVKNETGDTISLVARNNSSVASDDPALVSITLSGDSLEHTAVVLPGGLQFNDSLEKIEEVLSGIEQRRFDSPSNLSAEISYNLGEYVMTLFFFHEKLESCEITLL